VKSRHPVHVTLRLAAGLPSLRRGPEHSRLLGALAAGTQRMGLRVVHYSAQSNHVHLICEAEDERALARGMKGLCVRMARALNRLWRRRGSVFDDRYHVHVLETPWEVRNALAYVLQNARHHGIQVPGGIDPYSSASWFDGWKRVRAALAVAMRWCPLSRPLTWLLALGWKLHGLLDPAAPLSR
jgi:REP element-mobilizing transposase RayT